MGSRAFLDRFWSKVSPVVASDCAEWTAARNAAGYGVFQLRRTKAGAAHRLAWEIHHGEEIPRGLFVCHRCDNPSCCRPDHLFLGTARDNIRDMVRKGRRVSAGPQGEAHASSKLTEAAVREIRRRYRTGSGGRPQPGPSGSFQPTGRVTLRSLAAEYGVDHTQILRAVRGDQWGHLD